MDAAVAFDNRILCRNNVQCHSKFIMQTFQAVILFKSTDGESVLILKYDYTS